MSAVGPLHQLRQPIRLIHRSGEKADPNFTSQTSFAFRDLYLNSDKEDFFYFRNSFTTCHDTDVASFHEHRKISIVNSPYEMVVNVGTIV